MQTLAAAIETAGVRNYWSIWKRAGNNGYHLESIRNCLVPPEHADDLTTVLTYLAEELAVLGIDLYTGEGGQLTVEVEVGVWPSDPDSGGKATGALADAGFTVTAETMQAIRAEYGQVSLLVLSSWPCSCTDKARDQSCPRCGPPVACHVHPPFTYGPGEHR
jgi:hypothetical protein